MGFALSIPRQCGEFLMALLFIESDSFQLRVFLAAEHVGFEQYYKMKVG